VTLYDVDVALRANFERTFGTTKRAEAPESDATYASLHTSPSL
jgi:hypothetical protein